MTCMRSFFRDCLQKTVVSSSVPLRPHVITVGTTWPCLKFFTLPLPRTCPMVCLFAGLIFGFLNAPIFVSYSPRAPHLLCGAAGITSFALNYATAQRFAMLSTPRRVSPVSASVSAIRAHLLYNAYYRFSV